MMTLPEALLLILALTIVPPLIRYIAIRGLPTLDEYLQDNPESTDRSGNIKCATCGSKGIYIWWLLKPSAGFGPKKHICRTCGTNLWRS